MKTNPALYLAAACSAPSVWAFCAPSQTTIKRSGDNLQLQLASYQNPEVDDGASTQQRRREFLMQSLASLSVLSVPSIVHADDDFLYKRGDGGGDLTSQLFNEDGSLKDPNTVVEAQEKSTTVPFSISAPSDGTSVSIATDGVPASTADAAAANIKAAYKLPLKWNQDATSSLPLYYDSSEGKNGKACNRITVYSVSAPNLSVTTLEKASKVGVAKSLFMDQIPNKYFDQGALKADLIGGRTVRKPIKSIEEGFEGEMDEQVYYEFDLAFAPELCPDFAEGNKENLGLGFCPYDNIFLVSATVVKASDKDKSGTLMVCVAECNKAEWKSSNSDIKRVRSSFVLERA